MDIKPTCATLREITPQLYSAAGGKGSTLAKLHQKGYPVPNGIVVLPTAFSGDRLLDGPWEYIRSRLLQLETTNELSYPVAVRSSAVDEDSASASFAGEFTTYLNVNGETSLKEAIENVYQSRHAKRVHAYSQAKRLPEERELSVIVQQMVASEFSGVLFTADPVSGDRKSMIGNFVEGLGDRLVSGETSGENFTLQCPRGKYQGPTPLARFSRALYKLGSHLEKELGMPQDIEWTIAEGRLYLLQSRPITTLQDPNPASGDRNDTLTGDFLWTNVNFGEAIPGVMTPFTASVMETGPLAHYMGFANHSAYGVVCGRPYLNVSVFASIFHALGKNERQLEEFMDGMALSLPKDMEIPLLPSTLRTVLPVLPQMLFLGLWEKWMMVGLSRLLQTNRRWCQEVSSKLEEAKTKEKLIELLQHQLKKRIERIWFALGATARHYSTYATSLRRDLFSWVGADDADALISGMSSDSQLLASIGPVVGLAMVGSGKMSDRQYLQQYGHRNAEELELSCPRPSENPLWLQQQLAEYQKANCDVENLISIQRQRFATAWGRLKEKIPEKTRSTRRRIKEIARRARLREEVRSEYVRIFAVLRQWTLRAGALSALNNDIFFLTLDEVTDFLGGSAHISSIIPSRKASYEKNKRLPTFPTVIRGHFDPLEWAAQDNRCREAADRRDDQSDAAFSTITGVAGSAGQVEGVVRCLASPEDAEQLRCGEILVTTQSNIGWTFVYPKIAAIITDIGAPLSHAVIVAREFAIPAVVGCGDATLRLKTGDKVRVDGSSGVVYLLK